MEISSGVMSSSQIITYTRGVVFAVEHGVLRRPLLDNDVLPLKPGWARELNCTYIHVASMGAFLFHTAPMSHGFSSGPCSMGGVPFGFLDNYNRKWHPQKLGWN